MNLYRYDLIYRYTRNTVYICILELLELTAIPTDLYKTQRKLQSAHGRRHLNLGVVFNANLVAPIASVDVAEEEGNRMQPWFEELFPIEKRFKAFHNLSTTLTTQYVTVSEPGLLNQLVGHTLGPR